MKLKPVTFVSTRFNKYHQNTGQQLMLLKALKITQDPKKLKEMIGAKSVAEVFRTFDKLAMRKEYHRALVGSGVDFNFIVSGIKNECLAGDKSSDRLKGYQILLKSLGMDSYEDKEGAGSGSWEDALQKVIKTKEESKQIEAPVEVEEYEVKQPIIPASVKARKDMEIAEGKGLYD